MLGSILRAGCGERVCSVGAGQGALSVRVGGSGSGCRHTAAAPPESAPELLGGYGLCPAYLGLFSSCPVGEFWGELWGQPGVQGCWEEVSPREEQECGGITG